MKKFFGLMLAMALLLMPALGVFASGQTGTGTTGTTTLIRTDDPNNFNAVGTWPAVKQKAAFTMLVDMDGAKVNRANDMVVVQDFEQKTNIQAQINNFPYATALERKNIMVATGDYPDVIAGWIVTGNDVMTWANEGLIIPLETLIEQYTVNIKTALSLTGVRQSMTLPDGHIYSPPYPYQEPLVTYSPWINRLWLEQLGLQMPTTTDELKQVLIAFRDRIPAVNGQKIIPFAAEPNNFSVGELAGWFGVNASRRGANAGGFAIINGQIQSTLTSNEYKAAIKFFADLYKEGLVDPELFTQEVAMYTAKNNLKLYGVMYDYGPLAWKQQERPAGWTQGDIETDFDPMPVLKAPGVTNPVWRRNCYGITLFRNQFVITDKAKNPITILRWLDYVYSQDASPATDRGPLGVKWEKVGDRTYREIFKAIGQNGWTQADEDKYAWGNVFPPPLPRFHRNNPGLPENLRTEVLPPVGLRPGYDYQGVRDALYEPYLDERIPDLWLSQDVAKRRADIQTAISSYVDQKEAEWVSGQANIDAEWDAYIAQLNRLGLQELTAIIRNAAKL
ncbi:MAG: extracellular solute-binding protein [Treponema sp.]|jgi:putative aldouronate transport system substrate-binding protein|nr:extracellular solute-binding protein [Treponema sp.]